MSLAWAYLDKRHVIIVSHVYVHLDLLVDRLVGSADHEP